MSDHIPEDVHRLILDKLSSPRDHARSSVVCKMWYSIYKKRTFPWFVLSNDDKAENHAWGFFSLYDQKVYRLRAPELDDKHMCGSSHGWLITVDKAHGISLYEPFSKVGIQLPPMPPKDEKFCPVERRNGSRDVTKLILSSDPRTNPENCVILCVYKCGLMYCRVGDKKWTSFPPIPGRKFPSIQDAILHGGNFLVVSGEKVLICHLASGSESEPSFTAFCPDMPENPCFAYLASIGGNVLVVSKRTLRSNLLPLNLLVSSDVDDQYLGDEDDDEDEYEDDDEDEYEDDEYEYEDEDEDEEEDKAHFDVYKLDEDNMTGWRKENDIGAQVLFVGHNESRALPASSFPNSYANSIYYANRVSHVDFPDYMDRGIFDLKDDKTILLYPWDDLEDMTFTPPLWLFQN